MEQPIERTKSSKHSHENDFIKPIEQNYIKMSEVRKHNTANDCWFVIENEVYDITKYKSHPGQFKILLMNGGKDATKAFINRGHSETAKKAMQDFKIGVLDDTEDNFLENKIEKVDWSLRFDRFWMSACMFSTYYIWYQMCTNVGY